MIEIEHGGVEPARVPVHLRHHLLQHNVLHDVDAGKAPEVQPGHQRKLQADRGVNQGIAHEGHRGARDDGDPRDKRLELDAHDRRERELRDLDSRAAQGQETRAEAGAEAHVARDLQVKLETNLVAVGLERPDRFKRRGNGSEVGDDFRVHERRELLAQHLRVERVHVPPNGGGGVRPDGQEYLVKGSHPFKPRKRGPQRDAVPEVHPRRERVHELPQPAIAEVPQRPVV